MIDLRNKSHTSQAPLVDPHPLIIPFRRHALERASERGIQPLDVKEALLSGNIIKDYPDDQRGHSCLVCGKTLLGQYLHVVFGLFDDIMWIVTAYEKV